MKNRPLFYVFAGVVLGEGCFCISRIMAGAVMAFCFIVILGQKCGGRFFLALKKRNQTIVRKKFLFVPVWIGFCIGAFILGIAQWNVVPDHTFEGTIRGTIIEIGAGKTEVIRLHPYEMNGVLQEGSILLYGETDGLLPGNQVEVKGSFSPYEVPRNPGQFDLKQYYRCRGIYYSGFYDKIEVKDDSYHVWKTMLYRMKKHWIQKCIHFLPEEDAGILCAALLGEKSYLDTHLKTLYQQNGIAHILAISGLHISMIGGTLYKLLKKSGLSFLTAGMIAFAVMIPYCMMIGNAVAALRAVIMLMILIGADIKGRSYDFLSSASLAGILILYESPYYIFDAGFLLSFGAIFAIGCVYPCFSNLKRGQTLWLGISIWLVLLPIQLWFFYEVSVMSILLNFIVVPLMPFVIACGLIGLLTPLTASFSICHYILKLYRSLLVFPSVIIGQPKWYFLILYAVVLCCFCYLIRTGKWMYAVLCMSIGLLSLYFSPMQGFFVTFLDVGQGDCIVIHSPAGHTYMIDGGSTDVSNVGQYRILPYLKSQGISSLDYVMITHFDEDHYNGIEELMESGYPIKNLIVFRNIDAKEEEYQTVKALALKNKTPIILFSKGDKLQEKNMSFICLFPEKSYEAEKNQQSLVFWLKYKEFDCLLTGDLEKQGEEDLCRMDLPEVELLKVGHHGSKNASSEELLAKIDPLYAVISCGINNRYGHPHADTIKRLKNQGCHIRVTAECGAVMVKEKTGTIRMETQCLNTGGSLYDHK